MQHEKCRSRASLFIFSYIKNSKNDGDERAVFKPLVLGAAVLLVGLHVQSVCGQAFAQQLLREVQDFRRMAQALNMQPE